MAPDRVVLLGDSITEQATEVAPLLPMTAHRPKGDVGGLSVLRPTMTDDPPSAASRIERMGLVRDDFGGRLGDLLSGSCSDHVSWAHAASRHGG